MAENIDLLIKLLEETTTIPIISSFLKEKNLHHSASGWDELIDSRVLPAYNDNKILYVELISLLRDVEEHGKQHIFLFKCSVEKAEHYLSEEYMAEISAKNNFAELMAVPAILDQPEIPTIVDVRIETTNTDKYLIIKVVERRAFMKALSEETQGNIVTKKFERVLERAVNVIRLSKDGFLEMRLKSHTNSSEYQLDIARFWNLISSIIDKTDFEDVSLQKAKDRLWADSEVLSEFIRYSKFVVKNLEGISFDISCGPEDQNLTDSEGAVGSINNFLEHDGHFDKSNIWFLSKNGFPSKDLHVIIPKQRNEFAITASCTKDEYRYVISKLRSINI